MRPETLRKLMLAAAVMSLTAGLCFGLLPRHHDPAFCALIGLCWIATGLLWLRRANRMHF